MALRSVLTYAAIAIGVFVLVAVAAAVVSTIVGLVLTALAAAAVLLVLAGLGYAGVKGFLWYRGRGEREVEPGTGDVSEPVDRLVERYVDGDLTETELERRLDRVLGGPDRDEIDRELDRVKERS